MKRLKSKSYDIVGISVKNIRPDSRELMFHLQLLFQMCLVSSVVPDSFLYGTVTSILKRGKDASACSFYRPVSVTCALSKIFEYILLPSINGAQARNKLCTRPQGTHECSMSSLSTK